MPRVLPELTDENAFGLLIGYLSIEDDEYGGERNDFVARYSAFIELVRTHLREAPPGTGGRILELGHAVYVELLEHEPCRDLVGWLKELRALLGEQQYRTAGLLTYGASWRSPAPSPPVDLGPLQIAPTSGPSEPLRRALSGDAAARGTEDADAGWGAGLYLDVDAVEALGRRPKNEPTVLKSGSAAFYRAGS